MSFSLIGLMLASAAVTGPPPGPPPAHLVADGTAHRMVTGSYCWLEDGQGACVDKAGLPKPRHRVRVREGQTIAFRFGFKPRKVFLTLRPGDRRERLKPKRLTHWTVTGDPRLVDLFVRPTRGGDVSYYASLRVSPSSG
jgi:hypothetical protein